MFREPWFRFLAWFSAATYFFLFFMVLACLLAPPPNSEVIHLWMSGMMSAMHGSLMGIAMHGGGELNGFLVSSIKSIPLLLGLTLVFGILWRWWGEER